MIIFDEVINDIEENIAAYPAERGGLLFGPSGRDVIALFVPDKTAHTSSVTYTISKEMSVKAPEIERTTNLEYKGVIHSHPSSFDRPSSGDHAAAANALKLNPHMCRFFMPILTAQHDGMEIRRHELAINHSKIGGFAAIRGKGKSKVTMLEIPMYSVPAYKYLQETCRRLVSDKIAKIANVVGRARLMPRDGV
ncbi:MAG: Mov34/MPN/PAD-1 family protein, partial [Lentisphaerota bacterium]